MADKPGPHAEAVAIVTALSSDDHELQAVGMDMLREVQDGERGEAVTRAMAWLTSQVLDKITDLAGEDAARAQLDEVLSGKDPAIAAEIRRLLNPDGSS